ncbi:LysR family transcriptional regulator [Acinetobacter sp. MD2(2019)]|uniref:LysR family transcriptional regulator n=1 Tax=Acinetobacter sp. MD2(2019) TaxID=2605273 RepID=UPI002D775A8E|nr:LysR substrate-binding domain-containing protein [Acinetobacter sp. MD2(2019)]
MQRLEIFVAVVDTGSFTKAAQILGLTKAVVSSNIKVLEEGLRVSLLNRSTRHVSTTNSGEKFYQHSLQLLKDMEFAIANTRSEHSGLNGSLRITTTPEYGAHVIVPALAEFSTNHPQLNIQHVSSSKNDDLISDRFDIAIRLGHLANSNHHARLIDEFDIFPVVSPNYLKSNSGQSIDNLSQLAKAKWIAHSRLETPLSWPIITPKSETVFFSADSSALIMADSASALLAFSLAGAGVALLPAWLVKEHITKGSLIHLLPDHHFPRQGIYALYPNTKHVPEKVRVFIDFLCDKITSDP